MTGLSQVAPILPLYIEQLGVHNLQAVERWAGLAFGLPFVTSAVFAPIWGRMADKYGRKPMLIRASLGLTVTIALTGIVHNVYQLLALRLMTGLLAGFTAAAITLVATQAPKRVSGWALGTLSTGTVAGLLLGPLLGGWLAEFTGIRGVFFLISGLQLAALVTALFVREDFKRSTQAPSGFKEVWRLLPRPQLIVSMFVTSFVLQLALFSVEPIVTICISQLMRNAAHVALIAGVAFSAPGVASLLSSPSLGRLSDRVGPEKVMLWALVAAGLVFIVQAFCRTPLQFVGLRFALGLASGGLLPSINSLVSKNAPKAVAGRLFGYMQSALNLGTFAGAAMGGEIAALFGIRYVFFCTSSLLLANAGWVVTSGRRWGTVMEH
jgi:MFS family permease